MISAIVNVYEDLGKLSLSGNKQTNVKTMSTIYNVIKWRYHFVLIYGIIGVAVIHAQVTGTNADLSFITNGLSAFYPLNGNANDESGNNRNGTVYQAELIADRFGRTNEAYSFNAVNKGFITLPEEIGVAGATNLTVSLWFKTTSLGIDGVSRNIFTRYNWIDAGGVPASPIVTDLELYEYNLLSINIDDYGTWLDNQSLTIDHWYHTAFSLEGNILDPTNRMHLYLNGQSLPTVPADGPSQISPTRNKSIIALGAAVNQNLYSYNNFDGSIDDVRIYNRTLSAEEIASLYAYESVARPSVSIAVKSVRVTMLVEPGKTYQLESSSDLKTWVANGTSFTATAPQLDQDFDVTNGQRYFQLVEVP